MCIASWCVLPILPERIATHWGIQDTADGFTENKNFIFFIPLLTFVFFELLMWIRKFDPLKDNSEKMKVYYENMGLVMVCFFAYLHVVTILWNAWAEFPMSKALAPAFGILFIYIGYILPKTKQNWFMGIRTPWAMTSEENWKKTHELGGKFFIISGIISCSGAIIGSYGLLAGIICILLSSIAIYAYSYGLSKKN